MSPRAVARSQDYAAHISTVLIEAVDDLLAKEVPIATRGRLKKQIQEVINEKIATLTQVSERIAIEEQRANEAEARAEDTKARLDAALASGQALNPEDVIMRSELAAVLQEHPNANKEALLYRTAGVLKAAVRKGNTTNAYPNGISEEL